VAKPTRLEDTAALLLDFETGAIGTAETGWCDGARTYGFSVHGTQGKLVNPPLTGDLVHYRPSSLVDEDAPLRHERVDTSAFPNVHSHQHWVDCIRLRTQPPLTNARTAWHVTEVMLAGLESARTGRAVEVHSRVNLPHPT
jgi:predicted dehydrogenase